MTSVTIRDETTLDGEIADLVLTGLPTHITLGELIRWRVREEVARHNAVRSRLLTRLVPADKTEAELNGRPGSPHPKLDWERQAEAAEQAFLRNGYVVFAGDRQLVDLDESLDLDQTDQICFIRLIPLAGG